MSNQILRDLGLEQQQLLVGGMGNNAEEEKPIKAKIAGEISLDPKIRIPISIGPIKLPEIATDLTTEITTK